MVGKRIAVIGAGNTAMDTVRVALRVGAEKGMIVYRRSDKEMTARAEEHEHAIQEGVEFHWLTNPVEVLDSNKKGCLIVEDETAQTSLRRVFAGGDAVTGAATVILAAGAGKSAAATIHEDLCG